MPTIPLLKKKKDFKKKYERKQTERDIEKRKMRKHYYNMSEWKKLRLAHLQEHPICEICEKKGIIKPAQVHHLESPFEDGLSELERMERLLNPNNLQSLCAECHGKLHFRSHNN